MKIHTHIFTLLVISCLVSCSGTKKYFKAAEKLEKQGLVNEAAEYYLESLQRKPTNVQARIKLKEVGQKYAGNMSAEFFRNYNTQQLEASLESFERLKEFTGRTAALSVNLDYPKGYEEDYQKVIEVYCAKNYNQAYSLVNQKKYNDALAYIKNIKKYNASYKTTQQLEVVSVCEPLYQNAVTCIENKNYSGALNLLSNIKSKTETYKDMQDLLALASAQQTKSFILFEPKDDPKTRNEKGERDLEDQLFSDFNQAATKFPYAKIINNTPFKVMGDVSGGGNVDLIQAVRKATGADYFYLYDVSNRKEFNSGPQKSGQTAYLKQTTTTGTVVTVSYQNIGYNNIKSNRSYSYQFSYKLINAYTNQIISSQSQSANAQDGVEYNEFAQKFNQNNLNNLFPYNPSTTAPVAQFNPGNWRKLFSANTNLKTFDQLRSEALNQTVNFFTASITNHIK